MVETGPAVTGVGVGDRVLVSCISSCGRCAYCIAGLNSHCLGPEGQSGIGWVLGHLIDGTQAEYVRLLTAGVEAVGGLLKDVQRQL